MKTKQKKKIKNKPNLKYLLRYGMHMMKYPFMTDKKIFQEIYRKNIWGSSETVSGYGSTLSQTTTILNSLPALFEKYNIKSLLDIPCGDFHWMKNIARGAIKYTGADIVDELIENNIETYQDYGQFMVLDICSSPLPKTDLIFCRDCLVHFSFPKIINALNNILQSDSKYLLLTNFPDCRYNLNTITGTWRALNFCREPFNFPEPLEVIFEKPAYRSNKYSDKSLALWNIEKLKISYC